MVTSIMKKKPNQDKELSLRELDRIVREGLLY